MTHYKPQPSNINPEDKQFIPLELGLEFVMSISKDTDFEKEVDTLRERRAKCTAQMIQAELGDLFQRGYSLPEAGMTVADSLVCDNPLDEPHNQLVMKHLKIDKEPTGTYLDRLGKLSCGESLRAKFENIELDYAIQLYAASGREGMHKAIDIYLHEAERIITTTQDPQIHMSLGDRDDQLILASVAIYEAMKLSMQSYEKYQKYPGWDPYKPTWAQDNDENRVLDLFNEYCDLYFLNGVIFDEIIRIGVREERSRKTGDERSMESKIFQAIKTNGRQYESAYKVDANKEAELMNPWTHLFDLIERAQNEKRELQ